MVILHDIAESFLLTATGTNIGCKVSVSLETAGIQLFIKRWQASLTNHSPLLSRRALQLTRFVVQLHSFRWNLLATFKLNVRVFNTFETSASFPTAESLLHYFFSDNWGFIIPLQLLFLLLSPLEIEILLLNLLLICALILYCFILFSFQPFLRHFSFILFLNLHNTTKIVLLFGDIRIWLMELHLNVIFMMQFSPIVRIIELIELL